MQRITEAQFQGKVLQFARLRGWRYTHSRPGIDRSGKWSTPITGDKGFPDLVLVRGGQALFRELKSESGRTSPDQELWLNALSHAHLDAGLWRPSDWDQIQELLL